VRGLSWSASLDVACWFALRYSTLGAGAVYRAVLQDSDVFLYFDERGEQEYIGRPRSCKRLELSKDEMRAASDRHTEAVARMNKRVLNPKVKQ
jgi:hypothetical protein